MPAADQQIVRKGLGLILAAGYPSPHAVEDSVSLKHYSRALAWQTVLSMY